MTWPGPAPAAYCGPPPAPAGLTGAWNLDPLLLAALGLGCVVALRLGPMRRAAGLGGILMLAVAFVSPLCALTVALFSARAAHHLLVAFVAAPLLAAALPHGTARGGAALAAAAFAAAMWAWHWPPLYTLALSSPPAYGVMQLALLGSAVLLWQRLGALAPRRPVAAAGAALATMMQMSLLGALLTFAPHPLYAEHGGTTLPWGLGPLADQQLAGLLMWVPPVLLLALPAALWARAGWRALARQAA